MIKRDFIERLTQDIAKTLAKMMGFEAEDALEYIDSVYNEYFKLDKKYLDSLSPENIVEQLTQEHQLNVHQMEFIAELMAKEGEYLREKEQFVESIDKFKKALAIFGHVENTQNLFCLERRQTIMKIQKFI